MENSASRINSTKTENLPITQTIAGRRASLNMLSQSAPDRGPLSLAQLTPLLSRRASLPASTSCSSVSTQTPTDAMHFEFPDETFEFEFDSDDMPDGDSRQGSPPSAAGSSTIWNIDPRRGGDSAAASSSSGSLPEEGLSLWNRCLRRLSSHSDIIRGVGRRVSFSEQPRTEFKVQDVGLQLRSIGDDFEFERSSGRSTFTRTRSLSFVSQKKR